MEKIVGTRPDDPKIPVDPELLKSSIIYQGANEELKKYGILIPKKLLRIREESDMITAIEAGVQTPSQIAQLLGTCLSSIERLSNSSRDGSLNYTYEVPNRSICPQPELH